MEAMTIEFSLWLLGIALTMIGIGYALYYQGVVWTKPKQQEIVGKRSLRLGRVWLVMGLVYGILAVVLFLLS